MADEGSGRRVRPLRGLSVRDREDEGANGKLGIKMAMFPPLVIIQSAKVSHNDGAWTYG